MWYDGKWIPNTLVFSSTYDSHELYTICPKPESLTSFTYQDIQNNLLLPYEAFVPIHADYYVPVDELSTFVRGYLNKGESVATLDMMTYMYLLPILPEVHFLGPAVVNLEKLTDVHWIAMEAADAIGSVREFFFGSNQPIASQYD